MNEMQMILAKDFFLTIILLVAGAFVVYQIISVTKKHTIHNVAIVLYGVFFMFMSVRLFVQYIVSHF